MRFRYLLVAGVVSLTAFCGPAAKAQLSFRKADSLTYACYMSRSWDSLISIGKQALHSDIDYFWLRARLGTAYFEKEKYFNAAGHFQKALEFNGNDPYSKEMLWWSMRNTGSYNEARTVTIGMDTAQINRLRIENPVLSSLNLELGGAISNGFVKAGADDLMGGDSIYGEKDAYGNNYYGHLDFTLDISKRFSLMLGYSYLNFAKKKIFQYSYREDHLDTTIYDPVGYYNVWSFPRITKTNEFNYFVLQHEFHLGAIIMPDEVTRITPSVHLVSVSYNNTSAHSSATIAEDTSRYYQQSDFYVTFPFERIKYGFRQRDTSFINYLFSLGITRQFANLRMGLAGSWSNLNGKEQTQFTWSGTWYPSGNLDFYSITRVIGIFEKNEERLIFSETIGGTITKWMWAEGSFSYGNLVNGNIADGMIVYNSADRIRYSAGAKLILPVLKNINISIIYQYFDKEIPVYYYELNESGQPVPDTRWDPYQTHNIYLGINFRL